MTEERRVQLVAEVDTTRTRAGFAEIGQQANTMAQQVTRAGEQAERAVADVGGGAATSARNVDSASRSIIGSIQRTTAAMESGGRQTAAYYELLARQRGIDPSTLTPYLNALRSVEQAQSRTGASAAQVANAMRMVPAQLTDVATQLAGGQSPFLVLLQQGGQLRDSFGSIPATIRGVGSSLLGLINPLAVAAAGLGAVAYAYNEGSKEADAYNRAIIMSGNAAGTSRGQLADYAALISKTVGTQAEAAQALAALTATGQVGSDNLKQFGQVAVQVQKYIGRSVDDTVKDFAELGKAPVEASLKLSESYHYLTSAVYEQIKALQDQGKTDEAAEVAQKAYADAFADRAARMKENLGTIERAWMDAKESAAKAWDVFLGVGRKKTPQQELAEVRAQIALAQQGPTSGGGERNDAAEMARASAASKLPALQKRESELRWQVEKDEWDRRQSEISEKLRQAGLEWDKIMDGTLSKEQQRKKEIDFVTQKGIDAGASDADIAKAVNKINEKYSALNNVTLVQLENSRNLQKEKMAGELAELETQYKLQLISQDDFYAKKRDMQVREINLEIPILQKQAEIAGGKEDKSAQEKALGDLRVLMQRRANIISGAMNATREADFERQKSINNLVSGWDRTLSAERDGITQEVLLFGQSDQARKVYIEQLKLELEARKLIEDKAREGHAFTDQEIADIWRKVAAKKAERAEGLNEEAAIGAANQLLQTNKKYAAQYIADDELRARRITAIDAEQWQYLINNTAEGSEARKKLIEQFDIWMANRHMQPVLERWKGVIDNLDNNFQEGFRDMLTGGQNVWSSFAKSIGNTLKTSLADALYQTFVKKYVVQIVASLAGAISGPAVADVLGGAAGEGGAGSQNSLIGSAMSASSLISAGKTLYAGFQSGITSTLGGYVTTLGNTFGSSAFSAFGAGMSSPSGAAIAAELSQGTAAGTAVSADVGAMGAGASSAGYAIPIAGWIAFGMAMSDRFYKQGWDANNGSVNSLGKVVNAPMFLANNILKGLGLSDSEANILAGMGPISKLFGRKNPQIEHQGIEGTFDASGFSGNRYADIIEKGGLFRSDKRYTQSAGLDVAQDASLDSTIKAMMIAVDGFASTLGVSTDSITGYSKKIKLELTSDTTKDQEAIAKLFGDIGDELSKKLVPSIDEFAKSGEKASETLERLAGDFKGTDQVAQLLGFSANALFGSVGIESTKAREQLIDFAGGLSTLSQQASTFSQNFLTSAQRLAPVAEALDKALSTLGLETIPTTRDEFKALVDSMIQSGAAATEVGSKQLASLLALGDAFAQVHPDETADLLQLQAQAYDLLDDKIGKATILQRQHALALADMTPAMAAATQKVWDLQAAAEAIDKVKSDGTALLNNVDNAFSVLQGVVGREKDLLQKRIDKETAAVARLQGLTDAISSTLDSFKVPGTEAAVRQSAQAQIKASLAVVRGGGSLTDDQIASLKKAFSTVTENASAQFGSREDYLRDMLQTRNDIAELGKLTDGQLNAQETQLDVDKKQLDNLDAMLANAQEQINVLKGISTTGLSIQQALEGLGTAIIGAKGNASVAGVSAISQAYQSALGRAPDSAGLDYWQNKAASGMSIDAIKEAISGSDEARLQTLYRSTFGRTADAGGLDYWLTQLKKGVSWAEISKAFMSSAEAKLHPFAIGTNSVPRDMPAFVHKGERIIPAADNRVLMARLASPSSNSDVLAAEVKVLRETVAKQQKVIETMASDMSTVASTLSGASVNGAVLRVKVVN